MSPKPCGAESTWRSGSGSCSSASISSVSTILSSLDLGEVGGDEDEGEVEVEDEGEEGNERPAAKPSPA